MGKVEIPLFVKNLGYKIIEYILNLNTKEAQAVLEGNTNLNEQQSNVLNSYIQVCTQLRIQVIDQGGVDSFFFALLPQLLENGRHMFNVWREELGGTQPNLECSDKVKCLMGKLALEAYPLFLIRVPEAERFFVHSTFPSILLNQPDQKQLTKAIIEDESLKIMFSRISNNNLETVGQYVNSSGRGGTLQLATFSTKVISNAYDLMIMRGKSSQEDLISAINELITILRIVAEGKIAHIPVFVGFHNVGIDNTFTLQTEWGLIRPYNEGFLELIPIEARPSTLGGQDQILGFIMESECPYKVDFDIDFGANPEAVKWPPELKQVSEKLEELKENLSLAIALSIDREPPVGITPAWTLFVDPLGSGTSISWNHRPVSPVPHFICSLADIDQIRTWCSAINTTDDSRIRIAIRRVLSALNERMNPVDGFVDVIVAWENLFGGDVELSFRISMAIACLLENGQEERLELQKKAIDFYRVRSAIVHGVKEINREEAEIKRNECLGIALECIRILYRSHPDLINDPKRSKKLILKTHA